MSKPLLREDSNIIYIDRHTPHLIDWVEDEPQVDTCLNAWQALQAFVDRGYLVKCTPAEAKVAIVIIRWTAGYSRKSTPGKGNHVLTNRKLAAIAGVARSKLPELLIGLQQKRIISIKRSKLGNIYTLTVAP